MSLQAMFELSASQVEQVAGGFAMPTLPAGIAVKSVGPMSYGRSGSETGTLFITDFGSVFVATNPNECFDCVDLLN
jgi:hypothetical protein